MRMTMLIGRVQLWLGVRPFEAGGRAEERSCEQLRLRRAPKLNFERTSR
jgi:hypothetical protein